MTIRHNLIIRQGETYSFTYTHLDSAGNAIDLTGYSARMSIKSTFGVAVDLDVGAIAYLTDGSDVDGGTLTLGGAAGTIVISMTAVESAALASGYISPSEDSSFSLLYDLEIVTGVTVTRVLEGKVSVIKEITT